MKEYWCESCNILIKDEVYRIKGQKGKYRCSICERKQRSVYRNDLNSYYEALKMNLRNDITYIRDDLMEALQNRLKP